MKVLDVLSTIGALVMAATPLAVAGAAHAEPATPVAIQVGDLNFSNRADVSRFDARVVKAADTFCGDTDLVQREACTSAVREEAVDKLGAQQRSQMVGAAAQPASLRIATAE